MAHLLLINVSFQDQSSSLCASLTEHSQNGRNDGWLYAFNDPIRMKRVLFFNARLQLSA